MVVFCELLVLLLSIDPRTHIDSDWSFISIRTHPRNDRNIDPRFSPLKIRSAPLKEFTIDMPTCYWIHDWYADLLLLLSIWSADSLLLRPNRLIDIDWLIDWCRCNRFLNKKSQLIRTKYPCILLVKLLWSGISFDKRKKITYQRKLRTYWRIK